MTIETKLLITSSLVNISVISFQQVKSILKWHYAHQWVDIEWKPRYINNNQVSSYMITLIFGNILSQHVMLKIFLIVERNVSSNIRVPINQYQISRLMVDFS
jgi:hypothetical protein